MAHIHELYDFTVSFYILHPNDKKICLHYHKKLKFWNQLGGHIELNEEPMESLKRELSEEAGLVESDYVIVSTNKQPKTSTATTLPAPFSLIIYKYGETDHKHIDMPYLIQSKTTNLRPRAGESSQIGWFTLKEIKDLNKNKLLEDSTLDICEWIFKNIISL